jgi:phage gp29-like protein
MFTVGLGTILKTISDVMNKTALPKLMKINGYDKKLWPKITPHDIEKEDVGQFADNVYKLVGVGALIPDDELNEKIRMMLSIKPSTSDITPLSQIEDKMEQAKLQQESDAKAAEAALKQPKQKMPGPSGQKGGRTVPKSGDAR